DECRPTPTGEGVMQRAFQLTPSPKMGEGWGGVALSTEGFSTEHDRHRTLLRTAPGHHGDHHDGAAEERHPPHLDEGAASADRGGEAYRRPRLHAALRADAGRPGDAGILVLATLDPRGDRRDAGGLH